MCHCCRSDEAQVTRRSGRERRGVCRLAKTKLAPARRWYDREEDDVSLGEADRAYLKALEPWLGMYPKMRTTE